jgi:bifunctional UDP-N-acetylglucosamine pyrophosphorylase/glucosamine-1-phosphate N-acetyltransferase
MTSMRADDESMPLSAMVLAAGEGKRLHSGRAKVLHEVGGVPLIDHVLVALEPLHASPVVVVVGHLHEQVEAHLAGRRVDVVVQEPPRGTGDAVACALPRLPDEGVVVVLSGDVPLITPETLNALVDRQRSRDAMAALATAVVPAPGPYGRVVRGAAGDVVAVVEAGDATEEQRALTEVNAGTYAFDLAALRAVLPRLRADNAQGEYYLTDVLGILAARGDPVAALVLDDPAEMAGVNSRADLAEVHRLLNTRVIRALQEKGVTVLDPATTWVEPSCTVGRDTVLEPGVNLRGGCAIGERCRIGANAVLAGVSVSDDAAIPPLSHLLGSQRSLVG